MTTPQEQQRIVDEANIAGQQASAVTGVPFTSGTVDTYFPRTNNTPTEPLPNANTSSSFTDDEQTAVDTLSSPLVPETVEEIQARKTKAAQAQIDALNKTYQDKLASQTTVNEGQERRTSSVNTLTGLAGSSEAGVQAKKTEDIGNKQLDAIRNEQAVVISGILSDISNSAVEEARYQTEQARQSAEDILDMRVKRQSDAIGKLSILGTDASATLEGLQASMSPEDYDYLIRNAGGEAMAKSILFNAHSQNEVSSSRVGDYWVQTYTKPDGTQTQEYTLLPEEVLASEQAGTELVTTKSDNGTFYTLDGGETWKKITGSEKPAEAGGGVGGGSGASLTPTQITEANALAKQIYGSSTIKTTDGYNNFVRPIIARMEAGESIDEISDDLRFKGQSKEFTGSIRNAMQSITSDYTDNKTQVIFDKLDDLIGQEDTGKMRDFMKKTAVDSLGTAEAQQVRGKERTVEFLAEIQSDLNALEDAGINTNIFTGTAENIAKKVGAVNDAETRKIATKIATAIQTYRRSMSGVAFSVPESVEYQNMFPDISKTANFNKANIEALTETFNGDLDFTYSFLMGDEAYQEIFKGEGTQTQSQQVVYEGVTYNVDANGDMTPIE